MTTNSQTIDNQPWYKCGWPWFLFGLPGLSVVIGITLYVIANYWNVDSIVDGYYAKEGKSVELRDDRYRHAQSLGLSAQATVRENSISVRVSSAQDKEVPAVLHLSIIHPTQDRFDQQVSLQKGEDGVYSGSIKPLQASRWLFRLEDESRVWSMIGDASIPNETEVSINPFHSGDVNQAK
jgi:hypothetical protein